MFDVVLIVPQSGGMIPKLKGEAAAIEHNSDRIIKIPGRGYGCANVGRLFEIVEGTIAG